MLSYLPIPPPGQGAIYNVGLIRSIREDRRKNGGASRSRTGLAGFAIQSITALLSRLEREEDRILSETKKKSQGFLTLARKPWRKAPSFEPPSDLWPNLRPDIIPPTHCHS